MSKPAAGYVTGRLHLTIPGEDEPVPLGPISIPLHITGGDDYVTYSLGVDLAKVTNAIREIFSQHEAGGGDDD